MFFRFIRTGLLWSPTQNHTYTSK